MKEDFPYKECNLCRTLDDCKHRDKPDNELGIELPPDECIKAMSVMRRTMRKRKINKDKN